MNSGKKEMLSLSAGEILQKVNQAILDKKKINSSEDQTVLELFDEVDPKSDKSIRDEKKAEKLISEKTAETTVKILKQFKKQSALKNDIFKFSSGATIEEVVIELLKPQLSKWLDANLPGLVKNIVENEVKKLVPKDD